MTDSNDLRRASLELLPDHFEELPWGSSIWDSPIRQGKSLEWAVFTSILAAFKRRGWNIEIPALSQEQLAERFTIDNRYPVHFAGRPGHQPTSGTVGLSILSCLFPKAILSNGSVTLSVFKEGWPYHQIHTPVPYLDRPDILIAHGSPNLKKLLLDENKGIISYEYLDEHGEVCAAGSLRAVNAQVPEIIDLFANETFSATCIVECSINKLESRAAEQLAAYAKTFFTRSEPNIFLVTGVSVPSGFPVCVITLNGSHDELVDSLSASGEAIAEGISNRFTL
jgi:hypothetical protein